MSEPASAGGAPRSAGTTGVEVGIDVHDAILQVPPPRRRDLFGRIAAGGLASVTVADHVSFHGGTGFDGMVSAAAALATDDHLAVQIGVYQLALRHPLVVARQLASLAQLAPGRLVLGVGVGGEDRSEVTNCGVDPATRGRRLDECLDVLALLAAGGAVDHAGDFFTLEQAAVLPAPTPRIPLIVGGASDAAITRAATRGDGWLGIFVSPRRFAATVERVQEEAAGAGREVGWFGMNVWCGLDPDPGEARRRLAAPMEGLYHLPYERFERLAPAGRPEDVAGWLAPFVAAGARHLTLIPAAESWEAGVDRVVEVAEVLAGMV